VAMLFFNDVPSFLGRSLARRRQREKTELVYEGGGECASAVAEIVSTPPKKTPGPETNHVKRRKEDLRGKRKGEVR